MTISYDDPLTYYAQQGAISHPGEFAPHLAELPQEIAELCRLVQGLLIHNFWAKSYGVELTEERKAEVEIRYVERMLAWLQTFAPGPYRQTRAPEKRLAGNCRTFSVLLSAMLRNQGVPARARCGFGAYFSEGKYEDHWVCEYWNWAQKRWILVDAQLDELQREVLKINFDPLDVPHDQFLVGGRAWQMCRREGCDPELFGIFDMRGLWFIRGNLVRDIAALNKMALLPWDIWGLITGYDRDIGDDDLAFLDRIAAASAGEVDYPAVRTDYQDDRLSVPAIIQSFTQGKVIDVEVATEAVVNLAGEQ